MKIRDLGQPNKNKTNEGIIRDIATAVAPGQVAKWDNGTGVAGYINRNTGGAGGFQAQQARNTSDANTAYEKQWTQKVALAFKQAVDSGIIDVNSTGQQGQQNQQQTQQGFAQGNYKQNPATVKQTPTTVIPKTSIQTPTQQAKPQQSQPQGQALDLDQLKAQSQAKQQQGVEAQQQAMQQMQQTQQANAATSQADNELVARVKAEKAKPGFQQDKGLLRQAAAKGIHESALDDYVWFNTLIENIVENAQQPPQQQNSGGMSPGEWLSDYVAQAASTQGVDIDKFKAPLAALVKDFDVKVKQNKGAFPADIGKKLYSFWASAAASSPGKDQWGNTRGGKQDQNQQSGAGNAAQNATQSAQTLVKQLGSGNPDPQQLAQTIYAMLSSVPGLDMGAIGSALVNQQKQAQAQTAKQPPAGTPPTV